MPPPVPAEELVADADLMEAVRDELDRMPEHQRLPVHLRYFAELDYPEIAGVLRCSVNNARVRVHRSLVTLKNRLVRIGVVCSLALLLGRLEAAMAAGWTTPAPADATGVARLEGLLTAPRTSTIAGPATGAATLTTGLGVAVGAGLAAAILLLARPGAPAEEPAVVPIPPAAIAAEPVPAPAPAAERAPLPAADPAPAEDIDPPSPPAGAPRLPENRFTMGPAFRMDHGSRFVTRRSLRVIREGTGADARYTVIDGDGRILYQGPWDRRALRDLGLKDDFLDRTEAHARH